MAEILLPSVKGQALTIAEMEKNLLTLQDRPDGQVYPKDKGIGIKVDTDAPDWGWRDLIGQSVNEIGAGSPTWNVYQGAIRQPQFTIGSEQTYVFHIPHDYVPNTDIHIHAHWSHTSGSVSSGSITMQFEAMYSKGHDQDYFKTPVIVNSAQNASTVRYKHMINEVALSTVGGVGGALDTADIEVDGLVIARCALLSSSITPATDIFIHTVDIHYQSNNLATKNKTPDFWV